MFTDIFVYLHVNMYVLVLCGGCVLEVIHHVLRHVSPLYTCLVVLSLSTFIFVRICMTVFLRISKCVCICIYVCLSIYTHKYVNIKHSYVSIYVYICIWKLKGHDIYKYIRTHICTYIHIANLYTCTSAYVIYLHVCVYLCTIKSVYATYIFTYAHIFSVVQAFQNGPSENDQQGVARWESGYVDHLNLLLKERSAGDPFQNFGSYTWHVRTRVFSLRLFQYLLLHMLMHARVRCGDWWTDLICSIQ